MRYLYFKTRRVAKATINAELWRLILKFVIRNTRLPFMLRQYAIVQLDIFPQTTSFTHLRKRGFWGNSSRWLLRYFRTNRMLFKYHIQQQQLPGVSRSSW